MPLEERPIPLTSDRLSEAASSRFAQQVQVVNLIGGFNPSEEYESQMG